eukprot:RCo030136
MDPGSGVLSEDALQELKEALMCTATDAKDLACPHVEKAYPFSAGLSHVLARLGHFAPVLHVAVVGPPGAGKTTVLNALCGFALIPLEPLPHCPVPSAGPGPTDCATIPFLDILHVPSSEQPVLRMRRTGKTVAVGAVQVHDELSRVAHTGSRYPARKGSAIFRNPDPVTPEPLRLETCLPCFRDRSFEKVTLLLSEHPLPAGGGA